MTQKRTAPVIWWHKVSEKRHRIGYRKVVTRTFNLPDGRNVDFDLLDVGEIVCVFALTPQYNVVLARQFRPGPERILLDLPGGRSKNGESPEVSAARELREETGYTGNIVHVCTSQISAYSVGVRHHCVAKNCRRTHEQDLDDNEFIEPVEMPIREFLRRLRAGEIVDTTTAFLGLDHFYLL